MWDSCGIQLQMSRGLCARNMEYWKGGCILQSMQSLPCTWGQGHICLKGPNTPGQQMTTGPQRSPHAGALLAEPLRPHVTRVADCLHIHPHPWPSAQHMGPECYQTHIMRTGHHREALAAHLQPTSHAKEPCTVPAGTSHHWALPDSSGAWNGPCAVILALCTMAERCSVVCVSLPRLSCGIQGLGALLTRTLLVCRALPAHL